jgi:hypothetical protein
MKNAIGIVSSAILSLIGLYLGLRFIPVPTCVFDRSIRESALAALANSDSIALESAQMSFNSLEVPNSPVRKKPAPAGTKERLLSAFSPNPWFWHPFFAPRYWVGCFIPRHRVVCTPRTGPPVSIYVCFECGNLSVGRHGNYHGMIAEQRNELEHLFLSEGFSIKEE